MSEFTTHTLATSPQDLRFFLRNAEQKLGCISKLFAVRAVFPTILEAYQYLSVFIEQFSFTTSEKQFVLLSISRQHHCKLAAHGTLAKRQKEVLV
ncbi:hypothetical protein AU255_13695 [Methyloprofundus sedimenti]|uniref:Uncharacterized protein n=1 Tax=Methyloprofundus sedimenti TaxID=1420851 RepID=A0A1V8M3L8_9GAMM|nr:hypothetical protein [Methyloprofundus sedimenti]OQK16154.1 hypothetical protein AU255_13695 [Methyloprofundus sedimenti]